MKKNDSSAMSELKNLTFIRPEKGKERFAPTPLHVVRSNAFSMEETGLLSLLVSFKDFICKETILAGAYFDNGEYSIQTAWQKLVNKNIIKQKRCHVEGRWRWEYVINIDEADYRHGRNVAETAAKYDVSMETAAAMVADWKKKEKAAQSQPQEAQPQPVNHPEQLMRTQPEPAPQVVQGDSRVAELEEAVAKLEETFIAASPVAASPVADVQGDSRVAELEEAVAKLEETFIAASPVAASPVADVAPHDAFAVQLAAYLTANGFNQDIANDNICNFNTRLDGEKMIYDDYKSYTNHFEMWFLSRSAQAAPAVKSQPVTVPPVAPIALSATRHDNLKLFLLNDKELKQYLLEENFQYGEAEVDAFILRLNNDKITHDTYGKFAGHFKKWLPTFKSYQEKGRKLAGKQKGEKKGSNINFNKLRKAIENPKDGKTFDNWQFWVNQIVQETKDLTAVDIQYKNHLKYLKEQNNLVKYFQSKKQKVDDDFNSQ
jgi:hypothetical protein